MTSISNTEISEIGPLSTMSMPSMKKLFKSMYNNKQQPSKSLLSKSIPINDENSPPTDPNVEEVIEPRDSILKPSILKSKSPLKASNSQKESDAARSERFVEVVPAPPDPAVKVIVRIRPETVRPGIGETTVRKLADDLLNVGDRKFSFDSVLDSKSNQEDVFQLVGVPLVKNALAGYNTSILSYGQTGSGKTYTMWGPPSAMVQGQASRGLRGIVPRIFEMLFSEIRTAKENSDGKQINYQCRCSFLEIFDGQIGDLLDPTHRDLEIKDDAKNGFYIENLTDEYVTSYEEVAQILIKGLSNRKVGHTSMNAKSSLSHVVFTCIIESWCKEGPSASFSSSKTSRISLVDLAGAERNKTDDSGKEFDKKAKNMKKSLSQLGHLVSILAKGTKPADSVYGSSCLTHLLQDSLGGNSKLSVICTISPDHKNSGETLSTLRFGQQVRSVKNTPAINEITEEDVNDLTDQIRQLKEELIRAKVDGGKPARTSSGHISGRSVRESMNQLRISLNRSLILPSIDHDSDEELHREEDITELCKQLANLRKSCEEKSQDVLSRESLNFASAEGSCDSYFTSDHDSNCLHESENEEVDSTDSADKISAKINTCRESPILEEPPMSESPRIRNIQRKSIANPSIFSPNINDVSESSKFSAAVTGRSVVEQGEMRPSLRSSRMFSGPTESLASSLKRGLEIIESRRSSVSKRSSVSFSFQHLTLKPSPAADKANASIQTISEGRSSLDGTTSSHICVSCRQKDAEEDDLLANQRDKELANVCREQATKIEELTQMVEQLKNEKKQITVLESCQMIQEKEPEVIKETCAIGELEHKNKDASLDASEKEELVKEIQSLRSKLQGTINAVPNKSIDKLRSSLLSRSIQLRKSMASGISSAEELEKERERWTEMESEWISLTDELRIDIEANRQYAERVEMELRQEKKYTAELDDALHRAVLGHGNMVEHYVDLQEKYDDLAEKHRRLVESVADIRKAAAKAGSKSGSRFVKAFNAELSACKSAKEKERERLKKENKLLKMQLRDTAEAVNTAGELLVRLREAEDSAAASEVNLTHVQEENEKLRKQIEKMKKKHKTEMTTLKQYMAESKLPESALRPMHFRDSEITPDDDAPFTGLDDDQAWRAEFGAIYQDHHF